MTDGDKESRRKSQQGEGDKEHWGSGRGAESAVIYGMVKEGLPNKGIFELSPRERKG